MNISFIYDTDLILSGAGADEVLHVKANEPLSVSLVSPSDDENASDFYFGDLRFSFGIPNHLFIISND